eukprot:TRINITY_DN9451_c0_g1_i1.p1 TRINITY_DN9451_c0_g1~~TRINITY_DN9451_c0_g1_i1.p1  ORF type:complete len:574 (-),score=167.93 TRINITY_DN9451_c0_g1_i1:127-1716(-)
MRYGADKEALIHSARNLWTSSQEPIGFLGEKGRKPSTKSLLPAGCDSTDGSLLFGGHEDFDLSSFGDIGEDPQRSSDEKLLAMLGDMAKGSPADDEASDVMSLLPVDVQESDPQTRHLLDECGAMWEEVHMEADTKREMQSRLRRELRQLQERSERQHQESAIFMQRLGAAREALADKMKEATLQNQDLRGRISSQWRDNERLSCCVSESVKGLAARAAELSAEIWEVSDSQATLVEQLNASMETSARLQSELQEERVKTWSESRDVVMTFACGSPPSWHGKASSSSLRGQEQQQRELEQEEAERSLLVSQLNEAASRAAACGLPSLRSHRGEGHEDNAGDDEEDLDSDLGEYADAPDVSFETVLEHLQELEKLHSEVDAIEAECEREVREHRQVDELVQSEQNAMSALEAEKLDAEAQDEDNKIRLKQANELLAVLREEIRSEQAALEEEQQSASRRQELFRNQVEERRRELLRVQENNEKLADDLDANVASCMPKASPAQAPPAAGRGRGKAAGKGLNRSPPGPARR